MAERASHWIEIEKAFTQVHQNLQWFNSSNLGSLVFKKTKTKSFNLYDYSQCGNGKLEPIGNIRMGQIVILMTRKANQSFHIAFEDAQPISKWQKEIALRKRNWNCSSFTLVWGGRWVRYKWGGVGGGGRGRVQKGGGGKVHCSFG